MVSYLYVDVPFVTDRDAVVRTRWSRDEQTGVRRMVWEPTIEGPPVSPDVVRMRSRGFWEFTPEGPRRTRLRYEQHSEIGDSMPAWIVDSMMNEQIVNELRILRSIVESELPAIAAPPDDRELPAIAAPPDDDDDTLVLRPSTGRGLGVAGTPATRSARD